MALDQLAEIILNRHTNNGWARFSSVLEKAPASRLQASVIGKARKAELAWRHGRAVTISDLDPTIITDCNGLNQRILAKGIDLCRWNNNSLELAIKHMAAISCDQFAGII